MRLRFLLGPAGGGKTRRCRDEIAAELGRQPDGPPMIWLAPKQATFQLERQLLSDPGLPGYTRLSILSFERLAEWLLDLAGQPPPPLLNEEGRVMILRALLNEKRRELELFHASARLPGFAQELSRLLRELKTHRQTPAKLEALAGRWRGTPDLAAKLRDIARVQSACDAWMEARGLQDIEGLLELAADALRRLASAPSDTRSAPRIAGVWLDGFAELTPQEIALLQALTPFCGQMTLAFCLESAPETEPHWLSVWSAVAQSYRKCLHRLEPLAAGVVHEVLRREDRPGRFARNPVLAHLEKQWADPRPMELPAGQNALRLAVCPQPEDEVVLAAREIRRHARAGGRYRECAVLVRNLDRYHDLVRKIFPRYRIPFFLDRRESVSHHPLAELTRYVIRLAACDWRHEDWFGALKTGLVPAGEEPIDRLENEALARGWEGVVWRRPLPVPQDDPNAALLETLRQTVTPPFLAFEKALAGDGPAWEARPSGSILAESLHQLWRSLRVRDTLEAWCRTSCEPDAMSMAEPASAPVSTVGYGAGLADMPSISSFPASQTHLTVWEQMHEWLRNLALAFSDRRLPLREWLPIVEAGLAGLTVGVIPPALDQVLIGAVDRSRNPDLRLAVVLGLNESVFPAPPRSGGLLSERERDELICEGLELSANERAQIGLERYLGYIACTRARERLVAAHALADEDGAPLNPSPFVSRIRSLFSERATEAYENELKMGGDDRGDACGSRREEASTNDQLRNRLQTDACEGKSLLTSAPTSAAICAHADGNRSDQAGLKSAPPVTSIPTRPMSVVSPRGWDWRDSEYFGEAVASLHGANPEWLRHHWQILVSLSPQPLAWTLPNPSAAVPRLSPELVEGLYGSRLEAAVTRIELFAHCPFRFFAQVGLSARERRCFELDFREQGSFQHAVLAEFHERLAREGKRWRDISPAEARMRVKTVAEEIMGDFGGGLLAANPENRQAAESLVEGLQDFIETSVEWMSQYRFDPAAAELEFGRADPDSLPAWEIPLSNHRSLALRGTVDRVDLHRLDAVRALYVVLDYKSSSQKLHPVLLAHGVQLQLLAYLNFLLHLDRPARRFGVEELIPAGAFYLDLKGRYAKAKSRTEAAEEPGGGRPAAYKHRGRFNHTALPLLDSRSGAYSGTQFSYRLTKEGKPWANSADILAPEAFPALVNLTEQCLKAIGEAIFQGDIAVAPYQFGGKRACEHCDCQSVCRIDPWTHEFRVLT